jgi:hypothetical protein
MKKILVICLFVVFILVLGIIGLRYVEKHFNIKPDHVSNKNLESKSIVPGQQSIIDYAPSGSFLLLYFKDPESILTDLSKCKIYEFYSNKDNSDKAQSKKSMTQKGKDLIEETGKGLEYDFFSKLVGKEFFLSGVRKPDGEVGYVLLSKPTLSPDLIEQSLEKTGLIENSGVKTEKVKIDSEHDVTYAHNDKIEYYYSFTDQYAIITSDLDLHKKMYARITDKSDDSIYKDNGFQKARKLIFADNRGMFYVDLNLIVSSFDKIIQGFDKQMGTDNSDGAIKNKEEFLKKIENYRCMTAYGVFKFMNNIAKVDLIIDSSSCNEKLKETALKDIGTDNALLSIVPTDSSLFWSGIFDVEHFVDNLKNSKDIKANEFVDNMMSGVIRSCEAELKVLTGFLTGQYVVSLTGMDMKGAFPMPEVFSAFTLKDNSEKTKQKIDKAIECAVSSMMDKSTKISFGKSKHGSYQIKFTPLPFFMTSLSYSYVGDYLVLGSSIESVTKALDIFDRVKGNIYANPIFVELKQNEDLKLAQNLAFVNLGELSKNIVSAIQTFENFVTSSDQGSIKDFERISSYIPAVIIVNEKDENSIKYEAVLRIE